MIQQLLSQMAQRKDDTIPPHMVEYPITVIRAMAERAVGWLASDPVAPEPGCMFRTYNGSIVFCQGGRDDAKTRFCILVMTSKHGHFTPGEHYDVYPNGVPWANKLDWMGLCLAKNLGKPADLFKEFAPCLSSSTQATDLASFEGPPASKIDS